MSEKTEEKVRTILSGWLSPLLTVVITVMITLIGYFSKSELENIHDNQEKLLLEFSDLKKTQQEQKIDFTRYDGRLTQTEDRQKDIKQEQERIGNELTTLKIDLAMKKGIKL